MTDLVVGVKLKADGSGLIGTAREASGAVQGVGTAASSASAGTKTLAASAGAAESATRGLTGSAVAADRALEGVGAAAREMANDQRQAAAAAGILEGRVGRNNRELRAGTVELDRHGYGARNLGQQFGDLGLSIAGGISPARAFGQQAGQIGFALSEMGGKAGRVGAFLTGPWGIALTIAAAVGAPFVESLFEGGKAADDQREKLEQAATAADSYGSAQTLLGKIVDLSTGKIKTQNVALQQQIKLLAQANILDAQKRQKSAAEAATGVATPTLREGIVAGLRGTARAVFTDPTYKKGDEAAALTARLAPLKDVVGDYVRLTQIPGASQGALDKGLDATIRRLDGLGRSGKLAGRDLIDAKSAVLALATAVNDQKANQQVVDVLNGGAIPDTLKPFERPKKTKAKKAPSTAATDEFGRDAADRIASVTGAFDDTPAALQKTNAEVRKLDDLIDDLGRRKPPNFQALIASAEAAKVTIRQGLIADVAEAFDKPRTLADQAAKAMGQLDAVAADLEARKPPSYEALLGQVETARGAIRDGLARPFNEFVLAQQQSFQVGQLIADGRIAEANALRDIVQLERQMGPLSDEQRAAVLATNQALIAQERQIERLHRRQQVYLNALGDVRNLVTQTIFEGPKGVLDLPRRLGETFKRFAAEKLTEDLFGDAFDKLRDQVTGADKVENASDRMADAVAAVATHTASTTSALDALAAAANGAAVAVSPSPVPVPVPTPAGAAGPLNQAAAALDEIVVTARRRPTTPADPFASSIGQIAATLGKKIGIDDAKAERLGQFIGGTASKGLKGAVEGQAAASVAGLLGIKTSSTGASIGGAIGGLTGIPGGALVGGLLGGVVGKLFGGKPKEYGSSSITIGDGTATAGTAIGKGSAERETASALGGSVADGLNRIAAALGADLSGGASVSIGYRPGHKAGAYRVDTTGAGRVTGVEAFETEAEAVAFAIRDAIGDGAVEGLSSAVAKALQSSTDVDKAVAEALKVQQLETLLGGVSGQLSSVFKQFDAEATERVRLAKKYGLDLLQVEKINAEQRADLLDETLKSRVGSLKDLLSNLNYGDLFAGTATDRRKAILGEIDDAKVDADAGVEGAADRLADLYRQLITTSQEAFGTAGPELADDRAAARMGIERVIQAEEERVRAAAGVQAASAKALETVATLTDENNDLMTAQNDLLARIAAAVEDTGNAYPVANFKLTSRNLD